MDHSIFMHRCLDLAAHGAGLTAPNPMVGCVIVHGDRIIGEGYHRQYGGPHAEVHALDAVLDEDRPLLPEATLYVSLEPCDHHGKTPPCTEKILRSGIRRVVIGARDPNPLVSGQGIKRLQDAGLIVEFGVLESACRRQNRAFFSYFERLRPFVSLKWAMSADGYIGSAEGSPVHLSNSDADVLVHKMRAEHMAILIGGRTAVNDDPQLTTRLWPGKNPVRVVIDTHGGLPERLRIFDGSAPTIVFSVEPGQTLPHAEILPLDKGLPIAQQVLAGLWGKKINSVLVEGGTDTLNMFLDSGLWDAVTILSTAHVLGNGTPAPEVAHMSFYEQQLGDNRILHTENIA